jgi:hypothetical protein
MIPLSRVETGRSACGSLARDDQGPSRFWSRVAGRNQNLEDQKMKYRYTLLSGEHREMALESGE